MFVAGRQSACLNVSRTCTQPRLNRYMFNNGGAAAYWPHNLLPGTILLKRIDLRVSVSGRDQLNRPSHSFSLYFHFPADLGKYMRRRPESPAAGWLLSWQPRARVENSGMYSKGTLRQHEIRATPLSRDSTRPSSESTPLDRRLPAAHHGGPVHFLLRGSNSGVRSQRTLDCGRWS